jgi:hypothetical protein
MNRILQKESGRELRFNPSGMQKQYKSKCK